MDEHVAPQSGRAAALRRLQRDEPEIAYVFVSERKAPLTTDAVSKIVSRAGRQAGIAFPVHPHMLRHATSYKGFIVRILNKPRRGGPIEVIRPGDCVFFEPGEDHWRGATSKRFMTHLAMLQTDEHGNTATWGDRVTDEEDYQPSSV